jgi:hypothetical protein
MERRMLRKAIFSGLFDAAPRALLGLALVAGLGGSPAAAQTLGSDQQGAPQDAPVVPGIYDEEMCVMSIDQESKLVTFMSPNRENPNAAVAFAFKTIEGFKKGDLVKLKPSAEAKTGQPTVKVLEAGSSKCK